MTSEPRNIKSENYYHVYNRAAGKRTIFHDDEDFGFFYSKIREFKAITGVSIIAFTILYNHFHLLLKEPPLHIRERFKFKGSRQNSISQFLARLSQSYTRYYNRKYGNSGIIWEEKFKAKHVDNDEYLSKLVYYINLNAVKHKLVKNINDWDYTSHHDYVYYMKNKSVIDRDGMIKFSEYKNGMIDYLKNQKALEEELSIYIQ